MFLKKSIIAASLLACSMQGPAMAFAPTNLLTSHDWALRLPVNKKDQRLSLGLYKLEGGSERNGRSWNDKKANVLAIHDITQSTLAMVKSPVNVTDAANVMMVRNLTAGFPQADNLGHLQLNGKFEQLDASFYADYQFMNDNAGDWSVSLHIPVTHKKISGFTQVDLTVANPVPGKLAYTAAQATQTKQYLTNNVVANAKSLGNLDLSNWDETGIGDVVALLNWQLECKKCNNPDRSMMLHAKAGVSFPSSKEKDENRAFSMALGSDGAWGIPLGLGLSFQPVKMFRLGADAEMLILFDKSRTRRLKTDATQTEFLLLNTGKANKNHGLTWQLHAWAQAYHVVDGLSLSAAYQYVQHDADKLNSLATGFNQGIVNTANSLKESHVHNGLFKMNYDFLQYGDSSFSPHVSVFYKAAFSGKNIIDTSTWGGQFTVSF